MARTTDRGGITTGLCTSSGASYSSSKRSPKLPRASSNSHRCRKVRVSTWKLSRPNWRRKWRRRRATLASETNASGRKGGRPDINYRRVGFCLRRRRSFLAAKWCSGGAVSFYGSRLENLLAIRYCVKVISQILGLRNSDCKPTRENYLLEDTK